MGEGDFLANDKRSIDWSRCPVDWRYHRADHFIGKTAQVVSGQGDTTLT